MNVFIPYPSPLDCAKTLYGDKRFQKQIIECKQILAAIDGAKAWRNHPVCLMYKEHKEWLKCYLNCFNAYKEFMKEENPIKRLYKYNVVWFFDALANEYKPNFLENQNLLDAHKRRLYTKSPELYPQFAEYGTSEENWYYLSGQIVKYVNGKRIN